MPVVAFITESRVIRRIVDHLGAPREPGPRSASHCRRSSRVPLIPFRAWAVASAPVHPVR